MSFDFSKPETKQLYSLEVTKRIALGLSREQAEMLVAALMSPASDENRLETHNRDQEDESETRQS